MIKCVLLCGEKSTLTWVYCSGPALLPGTVYTCTFWVGISTVPGTDGPSLWGGPGNQANRNFLPESPKQKEYCCGGNCVPANVQSPAPNSHSRHKVLIPPGQTTVSFYKQMQKRLLKSRRWSLCDLSYFHIIHSGKIPSSVSCFYNFLRPHQLLRQTFGWLPSPTYSADSHTLPLVSEY